MNFKKLFTFLTTVTDEASDARKLRKTNEDIFDADTTKGKVLFKKEFLVLDHEIGNHSIMFKGRYESYKNLVLTDNALYIVGISGIEKVNYSDITSIINDRDLLIKVVSNDKIIYIYETAIPSAGSGVGMGG